MQDFDFNEFDPGAARHSQERAEYFREENKLIASQKAMTDAEKLEFERSIERGLKIKEELFVKQKA